MVRSEDGQVCFVEYYCCPEEEVSDSESWVWQCTMTFYVCIHDRSHSYSHDFVLDFLNRRGMEEIGTRSLWPKSSCKSMFSCSHRWPSTRLSCGSVFWAHRNYEPRWINYIFYLKRTFQKAENLKFDGAICEMIFYLFAMRKSKGIWVLLISLNYGDYILKQSFLKGCAQTSTISITYKLVINSAEILIYAKVWETLWKDT